MLIEQHWLWARVILVSESVFSRAGAEDTAPKLSRLFRHRTDRIRITQKVRCAIGRSGPSTRPTGKTHNLKWGQARTSQSRDSAHATSTSVYTVNLPMSNWEDFAHQTPKVRIVRQCRCVLYYAMAF